MAPTDPVVCGDNLEDEATAGAAKLEAGYDDARLQQVVDKGGVV
jgi:hypothetical protein